MDLIEEHHTNPSNTEAEKAVLSAIMLDNSKFDVVCEHLDEDDFHHPAHQHIFRGMKELRNEQKPLDVVVLHQWTAQEGLLGDSAAAVLLAELVDHSATAANAEHYAKIVRDKSIKRQVIRVAGEIAEAAGSATEDAGLILDAAEGKIFELSQRKSSTSMTSLDDAMHPAFDHIEALMNRKDDLTGVSTGIRDFDLLTGGLQCGDLVILAARPSMGKTALALNFARNAAFEGKKSVAVFSLEMTTRSLVLRLLSSEADIDFSTFHKGLVSVEAHTRLTDSADRLQGTKLFIDDTSSASILEIRSKCRRLHAEKGLDLVIVDYLQLARGDGTTDNREQEISQISRGLKALAKELNVPVVALSQLNRGPEARGNTDKRPMLSDLRESGAIEQDADVIGFIYRDVVYNKETEFPNMAELIIAKQRNGPVGTVQMLFENRFARFSDWDGPDLSTRAAKGHSVYGSGSQMSDAIAGEDRF